jgi:hypothetical protein
MIFGMRQRIAVMSLAFVLGAGWMSRCTSDPQEPHPPAAPVPAHVVTEEDFSKTIVAEQGDSVEVRLTEPAACGCAAAGCHDGAAVREDEVVIVVLDESEAVPEDAMEPVVLPGLVQDRLFEIREQPHDLGVSVRQEEREGFNAVALQPDGISRRRPCRLREATGQVREQIFAVVLEVRRQFAVNVRDCAGEQLWQEVDAEERQGSTAELSRCNVGERGGRMGMLPLRCLWLMGAVNEQRGLRLAGSNPPFRRRRGAFSRRREVNDQHS